jgi:DnaJ-class molecular chaperone
MRCEVCHGTGTIILPREPGRTFGYLALCSSCHGHGCQPDPGEQGAGVHRGRVKGQGLEAAAAR